MVKLPKGSFTSYPVHTMPKSLDVVWCRFPTAEFPHSPAPKSRPALVRAVALYANQTKVAVEVTYGTSKISAVGVDDLQIWNMTEMNAAGLPQATGFLLDRTLWLPWCAEFFEPREGSKTPIIGHLNSTTVAQLEAIKVQRRRGRSK